MKTQIKRCFLIICCAILSFLASCHDKEEEIMDNLPADNTAEDVSQNALINDWIYQAMSLYYYWNEEIVPPNDADQDPEAYFYSIINSEDAFSYITEDYEGLMEEFSGVYSSMGYSPAFGRLSSANEVFIIVEYVYPSSPAERAGLQRGDIILAINGQTLNTENYYDLYSQSQYTVTLGEYNEAEGITTTNNTLSLSAEVIETNPVLFKEVKNVDGKKVGYLVYTEFISGENEEWLSTLGSTIDQFSEEGVNELIVDLRYNPGGEIDAARYLASALAPATVVSSEEVLVKYEYNELLESTILAYEGEDSENLVSKFVSNGHNLNLNSIYFLTSSSTASASELLINGLDPYMDVIIIGETTVGKFYGSWVIPDLEEPARHQWGIMPIVLKYANAKGVTDFNDGLTPDYPVEDNLMNAQPFGSESDLMLSTALSLILGGFNTRAQTVEVVKPYIDLQNPVKDRKSKLLIKDQHVINNNAYIK